MNQIAFLKCFLTQKRVLAN